MSFQSWPQRPFTALEFGAFLLPAAYKHQCLPALLKQWCFGHLTISSVRVLLYVCVYGSRLLDNQQVWIVIQTLIYILMLMPDYLIHVGLQNSLFIYQGKEFTELHCKLKYWINLSPSLPPCYALVCCHLILLLQFDYCEGSWDSVTATSGLCISSTGGNLITQAHKY